MVNDGGGGAAAPNGDEFQCEIVNEFARVIVRKRYTRNGVRLEIASPRLETGVLLDAVLLESLTWQTDDALAQFLATPFESREPTPPTVEESTT